MKKTLLILSFAVSLGAFAQDFRNGYYDRKRAFHESFPVVENAVVMFGNSLTEQGIWWEYFPDVKIQNRGIGGDTFAGMADRLPYILKSKPSKIFILAGINDVFFLSPTDEEFISKTKVLIDIVKQESPGTKIYLQSLFPVNESIEAESAFLEGKNERVVELNKLLEKLAMDYKIPFIDIHSKLLSDGILNANYTYDGIHLNEKGYLIWVSQIKPFVK